MEVAKINAEKRAAKGKNLVANLRAEGRVPAVIYGEGGEAVALSLTQRELDAHLRHHHRIFQVEVGSSSESAYLQDVQWDCLTDEPLHVDFKRIRLDQAMEVEVEFSFIGHPAGASKGGSLARDMQSIMIRCLPTAVPESIEVNVSPLDVGDSFRVKDLELPEGVTSAVPVENVICHVAIDTGGSAGGADDEPEEGAEGEGTEDAPAGDTPSS